MQIFFKTPMKQLYKKFSKVNYFKDVLLLGFTSTGEINNKAHPLVIFFKDIVRDLVGKKCNT